MGFYIKNAPPQGKAKYIIEKLGGRQISGSEIPGKHFLEYIEHLIQSDDRAVIVIAHNKSFEAAALAYDVPEFQRFLRQQDNRRLEYIVMDKQKAWDETGLTAIGYKPGDNLRV